MLVSSTSALFLSKPGSVPVIDPSLPQFGNIWTDLQHITPTEAVSKTTNPVQLCTSFVQGECPRGSRCDQVHVSRARVHAVRQALLSTTCCTNHGNKVPPAFSAFTKTHIFSLTQPNKPSLLIPQDRVTYTPFWDSRLAEGTGARAVSFSTSDLCNSHLHKLCNGVHCSFVHICREWYTSAFIDSASSTGSRSRSVTPPSRGPTPPSLTPPRTPPRSPRTAGSTAYKPPHLRSSTPPTQPKVELPEAIVKLEAILRQQLKERSQPGKCAITKSVAGPKAASNVVVFSIKDKNRPRNLCMSDIKTGRLQNYLLAANTEAHSPTRRP
eukprot:NODE_734_length_1384_cov_546.906367_g555_i1.p1 GENE.NODE_734_length_1384_cov_546.906367_g555_i1~~NODE_734_length_1384_cov_546.906367_g555_i1.p1  ORF type:complete len:325 (-),score=35.63 NODE_734_length_1384_cov_546.906367_g555_i1:346-1320(-)